jgi:uncharacterized protein
MSATVYAPSSSRSSAPALFGRVMGLVAITVASATLGSWIARGWGGAGWFAAWLLAIGCLVGLNLANARGRIGLAVVLLLVFGLLIGVSVAATINYYAATNPTAVRQAFGATALFIAGLGSAGFGVRRDLSFLYRLAFWLLVGLIAASILLIFVRIPAGYTIWALFGLGIFVLYTVLDFNRLRRAGTEDAVPIAAGIFLDVLNVFLLSLRLFARSS